GHSNSCILGRPDIPVPWCFACQELSSSDEAGQTWYRGSEFGFSVWKTPRSRTQ
ncbi:hypothetical protein M9458_027063, partial [Cirrhinus mrigala]